MKGVYGIGLLLATLAGCASIETPVVERPVPPSAPAWQQSGEPGAFAAAGWLDDFDDARLVQLVEEGVAGNPALAQARARLAEGAAGVAVAGAPLKPTLDADLSAGRSRRASGGSHSLGNSFSAGLSLAWEADLWDKLSDSARAAVSDWQALAQDYRAARFSLAANIAKGWYDLTEAELQLRLSRQLVDNLASNLDVLEKGYRAGLFDALDIYLARANLATERSRLADRRQAQGEARRRLELFLGRYPAGKLAAAETLPPLPAAVPAGLPSRLLERRPDIRAAALRLERDGLTLARSHKNRFPSLRLTAELGSSSDALEDLLKGSSLVWSVLGGLSQPLLDGERLEALEAQARARAEQTRADYIDTVLAAFAEVEGALQQEQQLRLSVTALAESRAESERAETLAFEQYRAGLVDYITVLEAQRRAFNARSAYLEARNRQLQNRINLYLALGGDYTQTDDLAQASPIEQERHDELE